MYLYYQTIGQGTPIIILHGLYGNSDNWLSIAKKFANTYKVILPDLRNHGHSFHASTNTFHDMVDDIYKLIKHLNISNFYLIGHSMGGKVAILLTFLYPQLINKLIIVDIAPRAYTSLREPDVLILQHLNIIQAFASINLKNKTSRKEVENEFAFYIKNDRIRQFLLKNLARNKDNSFKWLINVETLQKFLPEIMNKLPLPDNAKILTPSLFIKGQNSTYLLESDYAEIKKIFNNVSFVEIPNAGHWVHFEQPTLFINTVNEFLIN